MDDSSKDLDECRQHPSAWKLYIMRYNDETYLCTGQDSVAAFRNLKIPLDKINEISVSQGIVLNEEFARKFNAGMLALGCVLLNRIEGS